MPIKSEQIAVRLERDSLPEPNTGCWIWEGSVDGRTENAAGIPYGRIFVGSRRGGFRGFRFAHRVSYETFVGPIPPGMNVCHHCDNPLCINPSHLFVGTDRDNARDREKKGRGVYVGVSGSRHHNSKLTEANVRDIRRRLEGGASVRALSEEYGVNERNIRKIRGRSAWQHVA